MTSNPTEFSIMARGLRLAGLRWGNPDHPPLLCLHGWLDNAESFSQLAPLIKGRQVIALDFPGHGNSEHRHEGMPHYISEYALDVAHVIKRLQSGPVDVLGHSMGAGVATCMASGAPKLVNNLILLDGVGPWPADESSTASRLNTVFEQYLGPVRQITNYSTIDELFTRRATATAYLAPDCIERIVRRNAIETENGWGWRTDPRLKFGSLMMFTETEVEDMLSHIKQPVMHITAMDGIMSDLPFKQDRLDKIVNLEDFEVEGHHHFHMDGAVEVTADHILRFLAGSLN